MKVKIDGLNFRSSPEVSDGNRIGVLPLAHTVEVIDGPAGERFWKVETEWEGGTVRGFVASRFLRPEESALTEKIIENAVKEWIRFGRGAGQENESPYFERVGDYWQEVGMNLDGRDTGSPWSAAFISFVMRKTSVAGFPFSTAHAEYICEAKKHRQDGTDAPYWLFRLSEHRPQLGDLVCGWRTSPRTFDSVTATSNYNPDVHFFPSHTDVIVEINDTTVMTIGGNVDNSVSRKGFPLTPTGHLRAEGKVFAIMRNNR